MNVWRIHIKNDIDPDFTRADLLEFCRKNKLIGVGWNDIKTRDDRKDSIRREAKMYSNQSAGVKAVNAMRRMGLNDLIWTRLDGVYYLCRVTGLWRDSRPGPIHCQLDISNYVNVKWLEIGMEDLVPGKVVSSFRPAASAQNISGVEEISQYIWNKYRKKKDYIIEGKSMDIWTVLPAESIEELTLLYLQVEKGMYIYSSTMKFTTREYECVMVDKEGNHVFPQVKSGAVTLRADDYMDALKREPGASVYLFAVSESYEKNSCPDIHYLMKMELERFIKKHRNLLPELTKNWIDLCGL